MAWEPHQARHHSEITDFAGLPPTRDYVRVEMVHPVTALFLSASSEVDHCRMCTHHRERLVRNHRCTVVAWVVAICASVAGLKLSDKADSVSSAGCVVHQAYEVGYESCRFVRMIGQNLG